MNPSMELSPSSFENLLENFKEENKQSVKLEELISIKYEYKIVTKNEIDQLLEAGKKEYEELLKKSSNPFFGSKSGFIWKPFHNKYPNSSGYYNLSRVGYGGTRKLALVYFYLEGGDHGSSTFYILEKVNDKWEVRKSFGSGFTND